MQISLKQDCLDMRLLDETGLMRQLYSNGISGCTIAEGDVRRVLLGTRHETYMDI